MKECRECHEIKDIVEFYVDRKAKDGHNGICKECCKINNQQYRKGKEEAFLQRARDSGKKRKIKAIKYKGGKCEYCGESFDGYPCVFDFHHVSPGSKVHNIAKMLLLSWGRVILELDKCVLLCANCHRKLHQDLKTGESQ